MSYICVFRHDWVGFLEMSTTFDTAAIGCKGLQSNELPSWAVCRSWPFLISRPNLVKTCSLFKSTYPFHLCPFGGAHSFRTFLPSETMYLRDVFTPTCILILDAAMWWQTNEHFWEYCLAIFCWKALAILQTIPASIWRVSRNTSWWQISSLSG